MHVIIGITGITAEDVEITDVAGVTAVVDVIGTTAGAAIGIMAGGGAAAAATTITTGFAGHTAEVTLTATVSVMMKASVMASAPATTESCQSRMWFRMTMDADPAPTKTVDISPPDAIIWRGISPQLKHAKKYPQPVSWLRTRRFHFTVH